MRYLAAILFLLLTVTLTAQYTGMYNGKIGMHNGKRGMIHAYNIPTSPENPDPPEPEPDDDLTYVCSIGNSIAYTTYDSLEIVYDDIKVWDNAESGATIRAQLSDIADIPESTRDSIDYVIFGTVGVNDIASGASADTMEARYDDLISTVKTAFPNAEIVMSVMTPCKGATYVSDAELAVLKTINSDYIMAGPTNVDIVFDDNWDDLTDGYDSIHAWYNGNNRDYLHPNWLGRRYMRENFLYAIGYLEEWTDSITMLHAQNFDGITAQTNPPHDSITQAFNGLYYVGGDNDYIFQTGAIVDQGDGDMALRSIFPDGQCCLPGEDGANGGTGFYFEAKITADGDEYTDIWDEYELTLDSGFTVSAGTKLPGVIIYTTLQPQRLMLIPDGDSMRLQWYSSHFADDAATSTTRVASTTGMPAILADSTYRITQRYYAASSGTGGFRELYLNGVCVARQQNLRFNNSATTTGYFDGISMSTFMGGEGESYQADHDEGHNIDKKGTWVLKGTVSTIQEGVINSIGTDISDMLLAVDKHYED